VLCQSCPSTGLLSPPSIILGVTERGLPVADPSLACPFVAYEDDRDARSDHADHRHRCYAEVRPAPRATAHQETYCLTAAFGSCPTFQDWARREAARVRWPSPRPAASPATRTVAAATRPAASSPSAESPKAAEKADRASTPDAKAAAAGLAASRFLGPEDLGNEAASSRDRRTWAAPPPWSPAAPGAPSEGEAPAFLVGRQPTDEGRPVGPGEGELLPAVEEWPEPPPPVTSRSRRHRERIDVEAPSWEQPRRFEAYPTIRSRVGMPSLSRPLVGLLALVLAAAALFVVPSFLLDLGGDGGGAVASPSPSPTPSPVASPSPESSPTPLVYVVKKGDTMTKIAKAHGVTLDALIEANKDTVKDPNDVKVGQELIIPTAPAEESPAQESPSPASEAPSP
jgi:nucleoid-associated protein YgaU